MLKALEILKEKREICVRIFEGDDYSDGLDYYENKIIKLDEAIAELEALAKNHNSKVKNCEGCKFGKFGIDSLGVEAECSLLWDCSRGRKDKWETK